VKFGRKLALLDGDPRGALKDSPGSTMPAASVEPTKLDALRTRVAAALGRPLPPSPPRLAGDPRALAFVERSGPDGSSWLRRSTFEPSHRVGVVGVDAARRADAELLALLALDPALARASPAGALYVDTETTGLGGGAGTLAFLVGIASFDSQGCLVVEQLLLADPAEEVVMLGYLGERLREATCVVSFNGKAFDLPLLTTRYVMNRLEPPEPRPHLDLIHVARRLHRARIGPCTLKAVEAKILAFEREGDIDGAEAPGRYAHYLRTGDATPLEAVVEHNVWDVVSMAALVGLYGEPNLAFPDGDLTSLARTLHRARSLDRALAAAELAVARGGSLAARRARAQILKAQGDRARALAEFEALIESVDDPGIRLELAKLYEHHMKQPVRALDLVQQGTGEAPIAHERRRLRLEAKIRKGTSRRPSS
jgi:uncharacterized protein